MPVTIRTVEGRRVPPGRQAGTTGEFTYSVVTAPACWMGVERRGSKRLRTRLRDGVIGERKHRVIADCRIVDRSRGGARLQLDKDRPLPERFVLTDGGAREMFRADLVWQAGRQAGVRLVPLA